MEKATGERFALKKGRLRQMKCERVVAFPFARWRGLILRLAGQMAARKPAEAEKYLQQQLRRQTLPYIKGRYPIHWSSKKSGPSNRLCARSCGALCLPRR